VNFVFFTRASQQFCVFNALRPFASLSSSLAKLLSPQVIFPLLGRKWRISTKQHLEKKKENVCILRRV